MDFDPVNRDVPASRYELESGSEDEFEHDGNDAGAKSQEPFSIASTDGADKTLEQGTQLVVLIGNAGAAFLTSLGRAPKQQYSLRTSSEQHAAIAVVDSASGSRTTVAVVAPLSNFVRHASTRSRPRS